MDQNLPKRSKFPDRSKMRIEAIFVGIFEIGQEKICGWLERESVAT